MTTTWNEIYDCAKQAGAKFPEVVAAQWALESAHGTATSGKNNFFGIKGPGTVKQTWEDTSSGPITINASFKDYASPQECINDLVTKWYKDYKGYHGVNRASSAAECCDLLHTEGYATDYHYSDKLKRIIREQH
jgi:flagellum-specific peptidoglycan hydrolase FlgJ